MEKTEKDIDVQVAEFLPEAMGMVIKSYRKYAQVDESAKGYREAQAACKVAVGHMALLMKLGRSVEDGADEGAMKEELDAMLAQADAELAEIGSLEGREFR